MPDTNFSYHQMSIRDLLILHHFFLILSLDLIHILSLNVLSLVLMHSFCLDLFITQGKVQQSPSPHLQYFNPNKENFKHFIFYKNREVLFYRKGFRNCSDTQSVIKKTPL